VFAMPGIKKGNKAVALSPSFIFLRSSFTQPYSAVAAASSAQHAFVESHAAESELQHAFVESHCSVVSSALAAAFLLPHEETTPKVNVTATAAKNNFIFIICSLLNINN
jgi:hypothetical protein